MTEPTILVVDDDAKVRRLLRRTLEAEGFRVCEADGQEEARAAFHDSDVSLVTLDINLGAESGLDFARELRRTHDLPIIMVTGRSDVIDRVLGLELGADDYIVKPFHPREMVARVRTVLRRAGNTAAAPPNPPQAAPQHRTGFEFDGMRAYPDQLELLDRSGDPVELTAGDFRLLEVFLEAPRRVLSRDAILDRLHGRMWSPYDRTIDNQIARLRKKIEEDPANPRLIKTVRGIGYSFVAEVRRV
jgi:DNA-binding response OmpR family regulator